jgi:hypothetical protein
VDGRQIWFLLEVWLEPLSGWRHWPSRQGGIVGVVFELRTRWASNVGTKIAEGHLVPNTRVRVEV